MDLVALLLECRISGGINLRELAGDEENTDAAAIRITATPKEHELINRVLADFVSNPSAYDISEMESGEELEETAKICGQLREELYGTDL